MRKNLLKFVRVREFAPEAEFSISSPSVVLPNVICRYVIANEKVVKYGMSTPNSITSTFISSQTHVESYFSPFLLVMVSAIAKIVEIWTCAATQLY